MYQTSVVLLSVFGDLRLVRMARWIVSWISQLRGSVCVYYKAWLAERVR